MERWLEQQRKRAKQVEPDWPQLVFGDLDYATGLGYWIPRYLPEFAERSEC